MWKNVIRRNGKKFKWLRWLILSIRVAYSAGFACLDRLWNAHISASWEAGNGRRWRNSAVGRPEEQYGNDDREDTLRNRKYRRFFSLYFFSIQLVFGLDAPNYVYVGQACAGFRFWTRTNEMSKPDMNNGRIRGKLKIHFFYIRSTSNGFKRCVRVSTQ